MLHRYFIRTPWLVRQLFRSYTWKMPSDERAVYLTFDDGPHPQITDWVLAQLRSCNALGSFFCIGNNVRLYPDVYQRIIDAGHSVGNHTFHHKNGWKTEEADYVQDVAAAAQLIRSGLFRPPYGRIRRGQAKGVLETLHPARIIMWDVLSADFDRSFSPQQCFDHVRRNVTPGSIIVFHDSEKAFRNLEYALPMSLEFLIKEGYILKKLEVGESKGRS